MGRAICGLYPGDFYRCIKQLNSKLRICDLNNSTKAAGLYYIDPQEGWISVCGVDKGYVPVATTVDEVGHILVSGWYRVVKLLLIQGLTTPEKVRKVWPNYFLSRVPKAEFSNADPILKKMGQFVFEEEDKRGAPRLTADQIVEISEDIHKKDTEGQKMQREKDQWELDKALGKNKTFI